MRQLALSISGISVTLKKFTAYDRTLVSTGDTEYSIVGTPLDSGPFYEPKHIWTSNSHFEINRALTPIVEFKI